MDGSEDWVPNGLAHLLHRHFADKDASKVAFRLYARRLKSYQDVSHRWMLSRKQKAVPVVFVSV